MGCTACVEANKPHKKLLKLEENALKFKVVQLRKKFENYVYILSKEIVQEEKALENENYNQNRIISIERSRAEKILMKNEKIEVFDENIKILEVLQDHSGDLYAFQSDFEKIGQFNHHFQMLFALKKKQASDFKELEDFTVYIEKTCKNQNLIKIYNETNLLPPRIRKFYEGGSDVDMNNIDRYLTDFYINHNMTNILIC